MNTDFETLLNKRRAPDMPEGLNARIIAAAARTEQYPSAQPKRKLSLAGVFVRLIGGMMPSPQPAWAVAAAVVVLAMGFVIGDVIDLGLVEPVTKGDQFSSFMSVEDSFTVQEWV